MRRVSDERVEQYSHDIIAFLEDQYILPETRKPIVLEQWQKDLIFKPLFYDLDENRLRKYNLALIGLPKKHGKSTIAAGVGLWFLYAGEPFGEVIVAANDLDQASLIIYNKIKNAIKINPMLSSAAHVYKNAIEMKKTGTTCRPVAHQYTSIAGVNPTLVLFDELWGFPSREFYDELTTSPARKEPLNFIVTYAGYDTNSLLYELYQAGLKGDDPAMFFRWVHDTLASWITEKYLASQRKRLPPNVYQRFHENRWAPAGTEFITQADIDRCREIPWTMKMWADDRPHVYIVACDLGLSHDRTARAVVHFNTEDGRVYLDNLRYWQGTPDKHVSIAEVEQDLVECSHNFKARRLVIDPWQMEATIQRLKGTYDVVPFNFNSANDVMHLSQIFVTMLRSGNLVFYDEPVLDDEMRRVVSRQTGAGWRIDHRAKQRNDCVITVGMAVREAVRLGLGGRGLPDIAGIELPHRAAQPILSGIREKAF